MQESHYDLQNKESYLAWKQELAKKGKTPEDLLALYEAEGMEEYVCTIRDLIRQMEESV